MKPTVQLRGILLAWLFGLVFGLWVSVTIGLFVLGLAALATYIRPHYAWGVLVFLSLGVTYQNFYSQFFYPDNLAPFVGQTLDLEAKVQGEARVSGGRQTLRLKVVHWRQGETAWRPLKGQILWQQAPLPLLNSGDSIQIQGVVTNLANFSSDFDAQAYWSRWEISHALIRTKILERPEPKIALNQKWRQRAQDRLQVHLNRPHLTVALGMLVGLKEKLPKSLDAAFKASGLQHLLVVSGTNVTLLVLALSLVLKPLGPWWRYGVGVLAILVYLYLVGFEPPALRASLFGIITGWALSSGNFCEYRNLFLLVAASLALYDPRFVTHDISFHLSFGATAGILVGVPLLHQWLRFVPWAGFRLLLAASLCAQMSVFPILIMKFGSFPYAGLLTNLFTEPLVPLIMFLAAGGTLIGSQTLLGLEIVWDWLLWGSIEGLIRLAQIAALLPEVIIPVWVGGVWSFCLLGVAVWASFSPYYQKHYWEKLEAEMSA